MMVQANNGGKPKEPILKMPQGFNGQAQQKQAKAQQPGQDVIQKKMKYIFNNKQKFYNKILKKVMMMQANNGGKPKRPLMRMPQGFNGQEQQQQPQAQQPGQDVVQDVLKQQEKK
ncbi:hypothetical protein pb186bvf_019919 [Paramecium bursaria]